MKTPTLATLAVLALVPAALASTAQARPHRQAPPPAVSATEAEKVLAPLRQAATECFAETVMANPRAIAHARAGRWYEAAGVIGFLCRPEVAAMSGAHDRLFGKRTGERYFKGAYARHLDRQLAERLQPLLQPVPERKALASAEPPPEPASAADDAPGH